MADCFISHSSSERPAAEQVATALRVAGHDVFLDTDRDDGIAPGRDWQNELFRALRLCHAVIFLNSAASQRSMWCHTEMALAIERGKPVYPVDLEARLSPHPILAQVQGIRLEADLDTSALLLCERLSQDIGAVPQGRWDRHRSPYPGLRAFEQDDAAVFFGRDDDIRCVLDRIDPSIPDSDGQLVAVIGPSGAGKSSLLRAGVLPRIADHRGWLVAPPFEPGTFPLDRLAAALSAIADHRVDVDSLTADGLARVAARLVDARPGGRRLLLVIDQAEQLTTLDPAGRDPFLGVLATALTPRSPVTVVITLRQDRLDEMQPLAPIGPLIREPIVVAPLGRAALALTVEGPAAKADLIVEAGLTERIINDAMRGAEEDPGRSLPLLAFTLQQMYERLDTTHDRILAARHYEEVGCIDGAIVRRTQQAEAHFAGVPDEAFTNLLTRFVRISDDRPAASRPVALDSLSVDEAALVDRLADERLVVADAGTVRLVHDRLIESWPRLADAVRTRRDDLVRASQLEQRSTAWSGGDDFLLGPDAAEEARAWMDGQAGTVDVTPTVRRFVEASEKAVRHKRRRVLAVGAAISSLALIAGLLAVVSTQQSGRRRRERDQAFAVSLAEAARASASEQIAPALLLAADASARMDAIDADRKGAAARRVWGTLMDTVHAADGLDRVLHLPDDDSSPGLLSMPAVSANGKRVIAGARLDSTVGHDGSRDPQFYVWDLTADATTMRRVGRFEGRVTATTFGASERFAAVTTADDSTGNTSLDIWDLEPGRERRVQHIVSPTARGLRTLVPAVRVAPDGATFVFQRFSPGRYLVFDALTGKSMTTGKGVVAEYLDGETFSPDGRYLVAIDPSPGAAARPVMLDLRRGASPALLPGGMIGPIPLPRFALNAPVMLAADPDGRAITGVPGSAVVVHRLGDSDAGAFAVTPDGTTAAVVFDPDATLPVAAFDLSASASTLTPVAVVSGFSAFTDVSFSPHGSYLALHLGASQSGATFSSFVVDNPVRKAPKVFQVAHGWPIVFGGATDERAVVVTPSSESTSKTATGAPTDLPSSYPIGRPCETATSIQFWDITAGRELDSHEDVSCTTSPDFRWMVFTEATGGGRLVDLRTGRDSVLPGGSLPWWPTFATTPDDGTQHMAASTLGGSVLVGRTVLAPTAGVLDSTLEARSDVNVDGHYRAVARAHTVEIRDLRTGTTRTVALPSIGTNAEPGFGWVAGDRLAVTYQSKDGTERTLVVSVDGKPLWDELDVAALATTPGGPHLLVTRPVPATSVELIEVPTGAPPSRPGSVTIPLGRSFDRAALDRLKFDSTTDGRLLAVSTPDGRTEIRRVADGVVERVLPPPGRTLGDGVTVPAFSPDGRKIAVGFGRLWLAVYDVRTGTLERSRRFPLLRIVTPSAFSKDGSLLMTGDGTLFDADSLEPIAGPFDPDTASPKFSADGRSIFVGGSMTPVVRLTLDAAALRDLACRLAGRNFTSAEWRRTYGDAPYRRTCKQWPAA